MEESWHVKLRRADQHLDEFEREYTRYRSKAHAHGVVFEIQAHPDLGQIVVCNLSLLGTDSQWLSAIAGDVVFDVRSALDHIAVAFTSRGLESKVEFPILEKRFRVVRDKRKSDLFAERTQGMPKDVKAFLLRMQPFSKPQTMPSEFLSMLNKLCNRDKHRKLLILPLWIKDPTIVFTDAIGTELLRERVGGVYKDGAIVFTRPVLGLTFGPADPKVKVQAIGPVNVTLQSPPPRDEEWILPSILRALRVTAWQYLIQPMELRLRYGTKLTDWEAVLPTTKV
ncbi:MAG: hypothetical protein WA724_05810 [Candidatus Dormiibacterota bacterium]